MDTQIQKFGTSGRTCGHLSAGPTLSQSSEVILQTFMRAILDGIVSHHMNSGCVFPASASTSGVFGKSLASQNIPEGAAEGSYKKEENDFQSNTSTFQRYLKPHNNPHGEMVRI